MKYRVSVVQDWEREGLTVIVKQRVANKEGRLENFYLNDKMEWKQVDETTFLTPSDVLFLAPEHLEPMAQLFNKLMEYPEFKKLIDLPRKETDALDNHLQDMRKIAFQLLDRGEK